MADTVELAAGVAWHWATFLTAGPAPLAIEGFRNVASARVAALFIDIRGELQLEGLEDHRRGATLDTPLGQGFRGRLVQE